MIDFFVYSVRKYSVSTKCWEKHGAVTIHKTRVWLSQQTIWWGNDKWTMTGQWVDRRASPGALGSEEKGRLLTGGRGQIRESSF